MFMTPTQEDGVEIDRTEERGWDAITRNMNLRPGRGTVLRLERKALEQAPDSDPDFEQELDLAEVHRPPLPLAEVMGNLKWLHRECNGTHVCGIPAQFASFNPEHFDLAQYLKLSRGYREHQAAGVRNRTRPSKSDAEVAAETMRRGLPHPEDGAAWRAHSNRLIERRERRRSGAK